MSLPAELTERIETLIRSDKVVLFMKGTRQGPQCGFSAQVVQILDRLVPDYTTVDVLSDPQIRDGIKVYSSWPTIPQLYVGGEFVGGCDIVKELLASGEIFETLGLPAPAARPPAVRISDAAAAELRKLAANAAGRVLHLVDRRAPPAGPLLRSRGGGRDPRRSERRRASRSTRSRPRAPTARRSTCVPRRAVRPSTSRCPARRASSSRGRRR